MRYYVLICFLVFICNNGDVIFKRYLSIEEIPNKIDAYINGSTNYEEENEYKQEILRFKRDTNITNKNHGALQVLDKADTNERRILINQKQKNRRLKKRRYNRKNLRKLQRKRNYRKHGKLRMVVVKYGLKPSVRIYKITIRRRRKKKPPKENNTNAESENSEEETQIDSSEDDVEIPEETEESTEEVDTEGENQTTEAEDNVSDVGNTEYETTSQYTIYDGEDTADNIDTHI